MVSYRFSPATASSCVAMLSRRAVLDCSGITWMSRKIVGITSAASLNQYWKAWTKVTERMPPETTVMHTTAATITGPSQPGRPVAIERVSAAPCICGTIYNQQITTTR